MTQVAVSAAVAGYAAGAVDGEGCLTMRRTRVVAGPTRSHQHRIVVYVANTSRAMPEFLVQHFGGAIDIREATARRKRVYVWRPSKPQAVDMLETVRPYLIVKERQADILLDFVAGFRSFRGGNPARRPRVSPEELERRERLYQAIKKLNKLGPVQADSGQVSTRTEPAVAAVRR